MAAFTKNRTYGKFTGFWVIAQKLLIISEICDRSRTRFHDKKIQTSGATFSLRSFESF
jgi:hypothetical protein